MRAHDNGNPLICANNLLKTVRYQVPYERIKGIDPAVIDQPIAQAKLQYIKDAEDVLATYEPRVTLNNVSAYADSTATGGFRFVADISLKEEVE